MLTRGFFKINSTKRMAAVATLLIAMSIVLSARPADALVCANCDPGGGGGADTIAPTVTSVSPSSGATNAAPAANVTVTFSENMDPASITSSTFTLVRQGGTTPVAATVSYDSATRTATLNPNADLDQKASYTATVKGGGGGVKDLAGNPLYPDHIWSFTVQDTTPPSVGGSLTTPAEGAHVRDTVQIAVDASDNSGSVSRVEFRVRGVLVATDTTAPYSTSFNTASVTDGPATIRATVVDGSGLSSSTQSTVTIDNTPPTLSVTGGPDGQTFGPGSTQTWTLSAGDGASVLASVQCSVVATGSAPSFGACSGGSGSHYVSNLPGGSYTFMVKARDYGGLETTRSRTFSIDTTAPNTTITTGPSGILNNTSANLSFSSSEPGSTFECKLDSSAFAPCTSPKSYTALANGYHTFSVRAKDSAGNLDATPAVRTWMVDTVAPRGSVVINYGAAYTNRTAVILKLYATDPAPASGVVKMRFSNDARTWSAWQAYSTYKTWYLTAGPGVKTVYAQYMDKAGMVVTARDTITLDTAAPTVTLMAPAPNTSTKVRRPVIAATVRDTQYNLARNNIQLYVDGRLITTFYYNAATDRLTYTPPALLAYGTHTVRIVARDAAGNIKVQQWSFKVVR